MIERLKYRTYASIPANMYFWRTYDQQEIDLVEERDGRLFGYECKWAPKKALAPPKSWAAAYPEAEFSIIQPKNYQEFVLPVENGKFHGPLHPRLPTTDEIEAPLAAHMRPCTLDEFAGRNRSSARASGFAAPSKPTGCSPPSSCGARPGTGKTTLAMCIANTTKSHFETLSAVLAGKAELRVVIDAALERRKLCQKKTVLFVKDIAEVQLNSRLPTDHILCQSVGLGDGWL